MNTPALLAARDNARDPVRWMLFWGIPIGAMVLTNLLPLTAPVKMGAIIVSFAWIGVACLVNAMRCSRVHCWFTGPWCLLTSLLLLANVLAVPFITDFSFTVMANIGGAVAFALWLLPELFLGKYFLAGKET